MNTHLKQKLMAAFASLAITTAAVAGPTFGFTNITNNHPANSAIGEAQLSFELFDGGPGVALFVFRNRGTQPSVVTKVLFDSSTDSITGVASVDNSDPGVLFAALTGTQTLPGGGSLADPFQTTRGLGALAVPPGPKNGINPGEELGIRVSLKSGPVAKIWEDLVQELNNGSLRIGLHVQAIGDNEGSEAFIHVPPVPEPSAILLGSIGLVTIRLLRNRQVIC